MKFVHELKRFDMLRKAFLRVAEHSLEADLSGNETLADKYDDLCDALYGKSKDVEKSVRQFLREQRPISRRAAQRSQLRLAERYTGVMLGW